MPDRNEISRSEISRDRIRNIPHKEHKEREGSELCKIQQKKGKEASSRRKQQKVKAAAARRLLQKRKVRAERRTPERKRKENSFMKETERRRQLNKFNLLKNVRKPEDSQPSEG